MKKFVAFALLALSFSFGSCLKKSSGCDYKPNNVVAPATEQQQLADYLSSNNITTATKHSSGMYYEIIQQGSGGSPSLCSNISIGYTGKLTNGNVFDSQASTYFVLGSLIEGWKMGLPLIQKGGKIRLYIPPSLGYGPNDLKDRNNNVVIPGNSILIFDITLYDFN